MCLNYSLDLNLERYQICGIHCRHVWIKNGIIIISSSRQFGSLISAPEIYLVLKQYSLLLLTCFLKENLPSLSVTWQRNYNTLLESVFCRQHLRINNLVVSEFSLKIQLVMLLHFVLFCCRTFKVHICMDTGRQTDTKVILSTANCMRRASKTKFCSRLLSVLE